MEENQVKKHATLLTLTTLLTVQPLTALDLGQGFSLKGFGTAGLAYNGDREADFSA